MRDFKIDTKWFDPNPILTALFGALLGSIITFVSRNSSLSNLPVSESWIVLLLLVFSIVLYGLFYNKLSKIDEEIEMLVQRSNAKLKYIPVSEISQLATNLTKNAGIIRVIGTARQDVVESKNVTEALKYLDETEKRFSDSNHIIYRRITSKKIKIRFAQHLLALLESSKNKSYDFRIKFIDNILPCISYQIFDDEYVIVIVDNQKIEGVADHCLALFSNDLSVVEPFVSHFDRAWDSLPEGNERVILKKILDELEKPYCLN